MKITLALSIVFFLTISCFEQRLKDKLKASLPHIAYPPGYENLIKDIDGRSHTGMGVIAKRNLSSFGAFYGLPEQVNEKMKAIQYMPSFVVHSFSVYTVVNQVHVQEYLVAAYANGEKVSFAVVSAKAWASLTPVCRWRWFRRRQRKCRKGANLNEKQIIVIIQALRARGFQEIQAVLNRNVDKSDFEIVDPANLLEQGLIDEFNKNVIQYFSP